MKNDYTRPQSQITSTPAPHQYPSIFAWTRHFREREERRRREKEEKKKMEKKEERKEREEEERNQRHEEHESELVSRGNLTNFSIF